MFLLNTWGMFLFVHGVCSCFIHGVCSCLYMGYVLVSYMGVCSRFYPMTFKKHQGSHMQPHASQPPPLMGECAISEWAWVLSILQPVAHAYIWILNTGTIYMNLK